MAKVKLTKAKTRMTKRNLTKTALNALLVLNSLTIIFILLNLYGVLELI